MLKDDLNFSQKSGFTSHKTLFVSASTNPPPFRDLASYLTQLQSLDIDYIHCDIMDGHFVPSCTFDYDYLPVIFSISHIPLDVHVMAENISQNYSKYIQDGVEILTIHYEAVADKEVLKSILLDIKSHKVKAGLAIKPDTSFSEIKSLLGVIDVLLIMSVTPGRSGQKFIENTLSKIQEISWYREENSLDFLIEVDGGVNDAITPILSSLGVDIAVAGAYLYDSKDRASDLKKLSNPQ